MADFRDDIGEPASSPSSRLLVLSNSTTSTTLTDNNGSTLRYSPRELQKEAQVRVSLINAQDLNEVNANSTRLPNLHREIRQENKANRKERRLKLPLRMMRKLSMLGGAGKGGAASNRVYVSTNGAEGELYNTGSAANLSKSLRELADEESPQEAGFEITGGSGTNNNRPTEESNLMVYLKLLAIFSTIYFFMWSSSLLSQAFNLVSYHYTGNFIRTSGFLQNPLVGLMVGVITTVLFQSSGAVTSVLVTIVGSGVLTVRQSIPIIMGANLGTSVTNTVVSLIVYRKKSNFEVAMTAGIVHDMYNMMSVVFLLPIELLAHPLERSSSWLLEFFSGELPNGAAPKTTGAAGESDSSLQFLSYLVRPLVELVIVVDKDIVGQLDANVIVPSDVSLVRRCCNSERRGNETICHQRCFSLFSQFELSDGLVCLLLSVIAMVTLFTCLVFVVKVTKSLLGGRLLNWLARLARKEYKYPCNLFVGYLFILVGLLITAILHSSGVFTSMLVPLAGGDVLNLMQIYELTLGSNVGTTTTGILAALSAQSKYPAETLQVALCHFLFNLAGILMFYSFPHTKLPIWASRRFGMLSARNMWFSVAYLVIVFLVAPSLTMLIYFATTNNQHTWPERL